MKPILITILAVTATSLCACSSISSPLIKNQIAENRTAQAKERWDNVRAGVKLQLAQQQFEAGRYPEARKSVEQIIAMTTENVGAFVLSTKISLEEGRLAQAQEAIRKAAALSPDDPEISFLSGLVAQRYGDMPAALVSFTEASNGAPQSLQYVIARIEALVATDRLIDAQELIVARLSDFDGDAQIRIMAARIHYMLGLHAPTVEYARAAVELAPKDTPLKIELGEYLVWAEEPEEAVSILEPLLTAAPSRNGPPVIEPTDEPIIRFTLARAHLAMSRWLDAQQDVKPLMSHESQFPLAWFVFARAAMQTGDYDTAAEALTALRHFPSPPPDMWTLSSFVALRRGELEWSRADAEKALQIEPASIAARNLLDAVTRAEKHVRPSESESATSAGAQP